MVGSRAKVRKQAEQREKRNEEGKITLVGTPLR
jgi:hypothetical protein